MTQQEMTNIYEGYVENSNLLTFKDASLYIYLNSCVERGKKTLTLEELAKLTGEDKETIILRLERLTNCELITTESYLRWIEPQT